MISMTWRLFGNGDVSDFVDRPVIEQFTTAAAEMTRKPHQAWGFKTLFRNLGYYKKFGVHRPKGLRPEYIDEINWVNGSGRQFPPDILRSGWRSNTSTVGYDLVTLNHYAVRSAESFLVKRAAQSAAVKAHLTRIKELRGLPEYDAIYKEITGPRLRHLSRHLNSFGSQVFHQGPSAVPDDFMAGDLTQLS